MGMFGTALLIKWAGDVLDVEAITDRSEGLMDEYRYGDWQVALFSEDDMVPDEAAVREIAQATGGACIVTEFFDSDAAFLHGYAPSVGHWHACLASDSGIALCETDEDEAEFHETYPAAPVAARNAAAWAREVGLTPDLAKLEAVLAIETADPFVEDLFYGGFLPALGLVAD